MSTQKQILLEATTHPFENEAVFNPASIRLNGQVHLYYRAVRKGNYSSIGYCRLDGPESIADRHPVPLMFPEYPYESQGMEDPRITDIDGTYYLTYAAYDRVNVSGALAISEDLKHFEKKGLITPRLTYREFKHLVECCEGLNSKYFYHYAIFKHHGLGNLLGTDLLLWDKNVVLFPRKILGRFAMLHRIHPGIQLVLFEKFEDLTKEFWQHYLMHLDYYIVMDPLLPYESSHIGAGCPPIETPHGWVLIYHAVEDTPTGMVYRASAALLDLDNPLKVKARLPVPLISPEETWEKKGIVDDVIFPTGTALFGNDLYVYYGAADLRVGVAKLNFDKIVKDLLEESQK